MAHPDKTYVKTLPRHHRLLIFVDVAISETALRNIIEANLHIWGGRYNPIVPVQNSVIEKEWLDVISAFDPDFIYYSKNIELEYLRGLNIFYPREYIELREGEQHYFPGVNIHCLLHGQMNDYFIDTQSSLLQYDGNWDMKMTAKSFYKLNFNFKAFYHQEQTWTKRLGSISINEDNAGEINKHIYNMRPYFKSLASSRHINSIVLDRNLSWDESRFEWIIYDPTNYFDDLLYFWNRQLYFKPKGKLMQVIATTKEMGELLLDPWFGFLVNELSLDNQISLVSRTLEEHVLEQLKISIKAVSTSTRIDRKRIAKFPFKADNISYLNSVFFKPTNNLIIGSKDYLKFPLVTFESKQSINTDPYALELIIESEIEDEQKEIKFPYDTELHFVLCKEKSRIDKHNRATIFINNEQQGMDISIPSDFELIRSVLIHRRRDKVLTTNPIEYIKYSNAGQKLSAFFNLFENNWSYLKQFLEEKFWLQLFRYASELPKSAISSGKGIFSYHDLSAEIDRLYQKYRNEIRLSRQEVPDEIVEEDILDRYIKRCKKEAFEYYIDSNLNYLISRSALFMGMRVKCKQCGSKKWYSLTELKDKLSCKGCNGEIIPNLDSKVYYKLSDTLINNLLSDQTTSGKEYDGNYIVLKTLIHLKEDNQSSRNSFIWSPCLDYFGKDGARTFNSDLDIVVIQNGKLIIGEAKSKSTDFSIKVINELIWAGNNLSPDQIIVACNSGNLDNVVNKIRAGLTDERCKVISYKTYPAWYHLPGIFGMPKERGQE